MKKNVTIGIVLAVLLVLTGFFVFRTMNKSQTPAPVETEENTSLFEDDVPENTSVGVTVERSTSDDNTVVIIVSGLDNKYSGLEYEVTYESEGIMKGVNSGSKPLEIAGQSEFTRDVYLGTCSRNVCKPDTGVSALSVVLQFTDNDGNKSQFSNEFEL